MGDGATLTRMRGQIRMNKRNNNKKNVEIKTNNVTVNQNRKTQPRPPRVRRNNTRERPPTGAPPEGIATGLSGLNDLGISCCTKCGRGNTTEMSPTMQFIANYTDPCGEQVTSLDAGKVPDGALQTTTALWFRFLETIVFPWQLSGTTDLSGKTYSMLSLLVPFLRLQNIIIMRENDGEFDAEIMAQFAVAFASTPRDDMIYPNWIAFGPNSTEYFSVTDTLPLRDVIPPGENGISKTILAYRTTAMAHEMHHNTPDLINQGTFAAGRFPSDFATRVFTVQGDPNALAEYVRAQYRRQGGVSTITITGVSLLLNGVSTVVIPSFQQSSVNFPSPAFTVPAGVILRTSSGSLLAVAGNTIQYIVENVPSAATPTVVLRNILVPTQRVAVIVLSGVNNDDRGADLARVYVEEVGVGLVDNRLQTLEKSVFSLPPLTQGEIMQASTKAVQGLLKDHAGIYATSAINEPVFNITKASSYRQCLLINDKVNLAEDAFNYPYPDLGWFDTIDANMMISVINFQGVPYGCKPFYKICKSVEAQPGRQSILSATTKGAPDRNCVAINTAFSLAENLEHGFPPDYNGLGLLFAQVVKVINKVSPLLQNADNIANSVKSVVHSFNPRNILAQTRHLSRH